MTLQEFQAGAIERAARALAFHLDNTVSDKRDWKPHVEGAANVRSALDMVGECILVNRMIAHLIRTGTPHPSPGGPDSPRPFENPDEAGPLLAESAKELADAVRAMTDADLAREYVTRRGAFPGILLLEIPLRNMYYHSGQINLIQLLYGDTEFRMPPPKP